MKRFILTSTILLVFTTSAMSQIKFGVQGDFVNFNVPGQLKDLVGGGVGGDLQSIYGLGYGGGIHFDVGTLLLSFRLSGDYIFLSPDKDAYGSLLAKIFGGAASDFTIEGGRIDVISATANLKLGLLPLPVVHVYATGGAGLTRLSASSATLKRGNTTLANISGVPSQTKPSINLGAGADLSLGGLSLYGEVKITWILTEGQTSTEVPLATVGLTF
jgi:opacity protein-like surface antigen